MKSGNLVVITYYHQPTIGLLVRWVKHPQAGYMICEVLTQDGKLETFAHDFLRII